MTVKKTILCVDDEHSLSIHKITLETRGYRVQGCSSVSAALGWLSKSTIDLVLSSLELPDAGQLAGHIKASWPETPVVLLCSSRQALHLGTGADLLLRKGSYTPAELLNGIHQLISRRRGPRRCGCLTQAQTRAC